MDQAKMDMEGAKVFGIGFHKTGTSSLAKALRILDYSCIHGDSPTDPPYGDKGRTLIAMIEQGNYRLPTIEKYDAFTDNPYFSIWKELDENYPGSKFILTIREEGQWIESCVRYYRGREIRPMRVWMFGEYADPSASEAAREKWLRAYREHNQQIKVHFKDRPNDLLIMNITKGEGWALLCPFLDKTIPVIAFPRENVYQKNQISVFIKQCLNRLQQKVKISRRREEKRKDEYEKNKKDS